MLAHHKHSILNLVEERKKNVNSKPKTNEKNVTLMQMYKLVISTENESVFPNTICKVITYVTATTDQHSLTGFCFHSRVNKIKNISCVPRNQKAQHPRPEDFLLVENLLTVTKHWRLLT